MRIAAVVIVAGTLLGRIAEAQQPTVADIALCNEEAQTKAGWPSALPRPGADSRDAATPKPAPDAKPGTETDPSGSIVTRSPDPLLQGMATDGLESPEYRTGYRDCMAGRLRGR